MASFKLTFVTAILSTLTRRLRFLDKVVNEFPNNFKGEQQYKLVVTAFDQAVADYRGVTNLPAPSIVSVDDLSKLMFNEHFTWREAVAIQAEGKIPTIKLLRERQGLGLKEAKDYYEKYVPLSGLTEFSVKEQAAYKLGQENVRQDRPSLSVFLNGAEQHAYRQSGRYQAVQLLKHRLQATDYDAQSYLSHIVKMYNLSPGA